MLNNSEQLQVNRLLEQMGLDDAERYKDEVDYALKSDYEANQDYYDNIGIVEKPNYIKQAENAKETARRGIIVNGEGVSPLKNKVIVQMEPDREQVSKGGIVIAELRPVKLDNPKCKVISLNPDTNYDFKIGNMVLVDLRFVRHRYWYKGFTHFVLDKDGVLGVFDEEA